MTVITKPLSEKKVDKLDQPLVAAECLPHRDVETGGIGQGGDVPPQDPRILVLQARARRASSVTTACLLLMALLVLCCGILGGVYLYKQFAHSQFEIRKWQQEYFRNQSKIEKEKRMKEEDDMEILMHRLRGWCRIPYDQTAEQGGFFEDFGKPYSEMHRAERNYLNEEFDIDGDSNSYEKITVPTFDGSRSSRFIHDFNNNKTGIVDVEERRCFVMPLNRTQVLPPRDLIDLVRKMWDGYYEVDTDTVRETMRVVLPPIKEPHSVGMYIERECKGFPIYKLEKIVSGVFKRSVPQDDVVFTVFSGNFVQFDIVNEEELKTYELQHLRT